VASSNNGKIILKILRNAARTTSEIKDEPSIEPKSNTYQMKNAM
jgi:predicted transcriptional regulator